MKKYLFLIITLWITFSIVITSVAAQTDAEAQAQTVTYGQGLERSYTSSGGFQLAEDLAAKYETEPRNGIVYYTPENPKPLCILMVTHPDCQIGIDNDGIYKVSEKGFSSTSSGFVYSTYTNPAAQALWDQAQSYFNTDEENDESMSDLMWTWRGLIEEKSEGMLMFVTDPDDADILLTVNQTYPFYGDYSGGGRTVEGHSCRVELTACQLTNPNNIVTVARQKDPASSVTTSAGSMFWEDTPNFENTSQLHELVEGMLGWYGYRAESGSSGIGVAMMQNTLISRGFLEGTADGSFGPMTEAAVKRLQEYYGLNPSGSINRTTLIAIYYEPDAVEYMMDNYTR